MRKVIINGATGVIGSALVAECLRAGYDVVVLARKESKRIAVLSAYPEISIVYCNLSELSNTPHRSAMMGAEVFFHLAWNADGNEAGTNAQIQRKNADYTQDAVKLAAQIGCRTFVYVGSQAEYGNMEGRVNGSTKEVPITEYGMAKLVAGIRSRKVCKLLGMKHIYARVFSVFGPNDKEDAVITGIVKNISCNDMLTFTESEQMWDYIYSQDAARALFLLALRGKDDKIYCIGSGMSKPLHDYIEVIRQTVHSNCQIEYRKESDGTGHISNLCADITDLVQDTGYVPMVSFEEGIGKLAEAMRKEDR